MSLYLYSNTKRNTVRPKPLGQSGYTATMEMVPRRERWDGQSKSNR